MAKKKQKQEWMTFTENGERFMQCKVCQSEYVMVDSDVVAVTCSHCVVKRTLALQPMDTFFAKKHTKTGRPAGWHWMSEFVDKDGNVFHKGKEQPKLKGTLKPTKVKPPKKKVKRRTKDQILVAKYKEKQALKKAAKKQQDFLNHKI